MAKQLKLFQGDYVRGGQNTLFMSRSDIVQTLAMLILKGYKRQDLFDEARKTVEDYREEQRLQRQR